MVHLVSYHLRGNRPAADYHNIGEVIKSISGSWCHLGESRWLVETEEATSAVRDRLLPYIYTTDQIYVNRVERDWAGYGLTADQVAWLNGRNFAAWYERLLALLPVPRPVQQAAKVAPLAIGAFRALGR